MDDLANVIADATGAPQIRSPLIISTSGTSTSQKQSPLETALQAEGTTGAKADLARSIYQQESSSGKNAATSNAGAVGGMQVTPSAFADVADKGWSINDPVQNARAGVRYASQMYDKSGGDPKIAAAGYYGGPGGLSKAQQGVAVSDPRNPNAPNTLQYGAQVAGRMQPQYGYQAPQAFNADTVIAALNGQDSSSEAPHQIGTLPTKSLVDQIPGSGGDGNTKITMDQPTTWLEKLQGADEAGSSALVGMGSGIIGSVAGLGYGLTHDYGTAQGVKNAEKFGADLTEKLTPTPNSQVGRQYAQNIGEAMNDSGGMGLAPIAEMQMLGHMKYPKAGAIASDAAQEAQQRIEPTLKPRIKLNTDGTQTPVNSVGQPIAEQSSTGGLQSVGVAAVRNPDLGPNLAQGNSAIETAQSNLSNPAVDRASRVQTLNDIGLGTARESAISGNGPNAAVDYHVGKYSEPAGIAAKNQFAEERAALQGQAEKIVSDTGATGSLDQDGRITSGRAILEPLDSLKQWFGDQWRDLYKRADAQAGGTPVDMPSMHAFVSGDKADFLGTTEGESLLKGVNARMKSLGMIDDNGDPQPVTVKQAEKLKQYLGNQWQPRTSRLISGMKNAIDEDVIRTGGENGDIYRDARNMRRMQALTIDDPNGLAKILDSSGPDAINRKVPIENVASTIAALPDAQFQHILNVLRSVPEELQPQGQAALAEIKGHFANKLLDAGSNTPGGKTREIWANTPVNTFIKNNSSKLQSLFTPDEVKQISTLRDAGNILSVDPAYPGASAQAANALKRGMMSKAIGNIATMAGGGAGSVIGLPGAGAVAGRMLGEKMSSRMGEGEALRNFQKGTVRLSDFP